MSVSTRLVRLGKDLVQPHPPDEEQEVPTSVIEGEFTLNDCVDVHIGPRNEHNTNIVINQNISVTSEEGLSREFSAVLKKRLESFNNGDDTLKRPINHCCLRVLLATVAAISITAIISVIIMVSITTGDIPPHSEDKKSNENKRSASAEQEKDYPVKLKFVSRESWGAAQPEEELLQNDLPVRRVVFIHTAGAGTCNKIVACKEQVQSIQEMHMDPSLNLGDIGYNFVLGSDGYIYVGRGWDKVGAHSKGFNTGSLGVAFIGDFRKDVPNDLMLTSAKRFLKFGVEIKKLSDDYQLFGHCQIHSSFPLSPGKNILKEIKTWNHWNSTNVDRCVG